MAIESKPVIALISSPQNSKTSDLKNTNLLSIPVYKRIVSQFDRALGVHEGESLDEKRQIASVVNSVASHGAFVHQLRERLPTGSVSLRSDPFNLFLTGHSVGEMASMIEAGVTDIKTMAWILSERERITERPIGSGIRFMLAAVNIDIDRFEMPVRQIAEEFGGKVTAVLANRNTAFQGVFSLHATEGERGAIVRKLNELVAEFKHPHSEKPVRLFPLPIPNAFHSPMLSFEEALFIRIVKPIVSASTFRAPDPAVTYYSPMIGAQVKNRRQALDVLYHQLTYGVDFKSAMEYMALLPNLAGVVTADITGTSKKLASDNIGDAAPIYNIEDAESLDHTVDQITRMWRI
jgi:hypothetical protein